MLLYMCCSFFGGSMSKQLRSSRHKSLLRVLTEAREQAGITQRALAEKLNRPHSFIGKIESGERQLNVLEFCELAEALNIDPTSLLRRVIKG